MTTGSLKTPMPYAQALQIAVNFVNAIRPYCERVEIAGSLRRRKAIVGDLEVVAIAKTEPVYDMFGEVAGQTSLLDPVLADRYHKILGGDKYRKYLLDDGKHPIPLDLYLTDPQRWGVRFTLSTGSADFSKYLVTTRQQGGALPSYMRVSDNLLWSGGGQAVETPEEADFFRAISHPYIEPEERAEGRWGR